MRGEGRGEGGEARGEEDGVVEGEGGGGERGGGEEAEGDAEVPGCCGEPLGGLVGGWKVGWGEEGGRRGDGKGGRMEGDGKGTHQTCDGEVGALDVRSLYAFFGDAVRERGLQGGELGCGHGGWGSERDGGGSGGVVPGVEECLVEVAEEGDEVQEAGDDGCVGVGRRGDGERDRAAQGQGTVALQGVGALGDDEKPEGAAAEEGRARGHAEVGFFLVQAQGFQQGDGFAEVEPGGVVAVAVEEAGEDEEARVHVLE